MKRERRKSDERKPRNGEREREREREGIEGKKRGAMRETKTARDAERESSPLSRRGESGVLLFG